MNTFVVIYAVVISVLCLFFVVILHLLFKQLRSIHEYMKLIKQEETEVRIPVEFPCPSVETLVDDINEVSVSYRESACTLREKDRAMKESITNISHDIRTPLTAIAGYTQMLMASDQLTVKDKESVRIIEERTQVLNRLLNQLFDYTRIESGTFSFELQELNLNAVLRSVLASFYASYESRGVEPQVELSESFFLFWGDLNAVTRVFTNVIYNSLVHGTRKYRIQSIEEETNYIFIFENDAVGIEPEDLDHIFERFYTTDKSRTKKTTGLGLTITKKLVNMMGGEVQASLKNDLFGITIRLPKPSH